MFVAVRRRPGVQFAFERELRIGGHAFHDHVHPRVAREVRVDPSELFAAAAEAVHVHPELGARARGPHVVVAVGRLDQGPTVDRALQERFEFVALEREPDRPEVIRHQGPVIGSPRADSCVFRQLRHDLLYR